MSDETTSIEETIVNSAQQAQAAQTATTTVGEPGAAQETAFDGPEWMAKLPKEMQEDPSLRLFSNEENLAKSYVNLRKKMGASEDEIIRVPKGEEEFEEVYKKLGRPEAPDKYEFERPEMPDGMEYDAEGEEFLRKMAFENGLNSKQAANIYSTVVKQRLEQYNDISNASSEYQQKLAEDVKTRLGDAYQSRINGARAVMESADDEFKTLLETTEVGGYKLGDHPAFVDHMGQLGGRLLGDKALKGADSEAMTPADVKAEIESFRGKNQDALYDSTHPDHNKTVTQLGRLYDKLHQ